MSKRTALLICAAIFQASGAWGATIAYYRFENGVAGTAASGNGTILDSSGNGLNGSPNLGPVYSSNVPVNPIPATGAPNNLSLNFNGDQSVIIPDNSAFQLTHSMTVEAYVDVTGAPQNSNDESVILFRGDDRSANDPYKLVVTGNGSTASFQIEESASVSATIPLNTWVFLAATLDDSTGKLSFYVNGQLENQITTSVRPAGPLESNEVPGLGIGGFQDPNYFSGETEFNEFFNGYIDEVRISDTALQPSQFLDFPEPASAGLLGIAATTVLTRRRRKAGR